MEQKMIRTPKKEVLKADREWIRSQIKIWESVRKFYQDKVDEAEVELLVLRYEMRHKKVQ